jgi:hypothetical protein
MHTAWRPLHPPSPLGVVFVVTVVVLLAAGMLLVRGIAELLGVDAEAVLAPWQSLGLR